MSRIISGLAGSIKLKTAAKSTRPTSDRVKESLFSKLENLGVIEGAKVLDLYAGSGALGLEAASRGASEVILVEKDKAASEVIKENIRLVAKAVGPKVPITLQVKEVKKFLGRLAASYDLVFIDPPYELANDEVQRNLDSLTYNLNRGAVVVIERSSRTPRIQIPEKLRLSDHRLFGDTAVTICVFLPPDL
ncbi:MAG: rRNA ((966)-N(2))-methyltransferase RsmD [Actinomycetota bacterium]